ncbi:MAG: GDSL-type esterase/lipase family protein [Bacteroidales bacterium]|nr:GDSL-type esterase/lipase family protein [Bacteroidales bacterium]
MKTWIVAICASLAMMSCAKNEYVKIACVGDSITEGMQIDWQSDNAYPALLDSILGDGYEVMNFGRSATTMMKTGDFPYWSAKEFTNALRYHPDIIVLKLGTNDSKLFQWDAKKYEESYEAMLDTFMSIVPKPEIILCSPAWVMTDRWEITDSVVVNEVIPIVNEIAKRRNLEVIDLYSALEGHNEAYHEDGIHPIKGGAKIIAEEVAKHIKTMR